MSRQGWRNRVARRAARGSVRHDKGRWAVAWLERGMLRRHGPWRSPSRPGGRITSPSATASGSPDRLLCPDPVRHMSVINGLSNACSYTAMVCALGSNCSRSWSGGISRRSARHKRPQYRLADKGGRGVRTRRTDVALLERAVCRPLALPTGPGGDKSPNYRADLAILRVVTGGRCWVRTNVG